MTNISLEAQKFWNAAKFIRHAPSRDPTIAVKIIERAARSDFEHLRTRAIKLLEGLE